MFFSTSLITSLLLLVPAISAHAGLTGNPSKFQRSDVLTSPGCNIQLALASPIKANSDGTFAAVCKSFNGGTDGATTIKSALIDTTGGGTAFSVPTKILKNGNPDPQSATQNTLEFQIPPETNCKGGVCLIQGKTTAGFFSCIAVQQSGGNGGNGNGGAKNNKAEVVVNEVVSANSTDVGSDSMEKDCDSTGDQSSKKRDHKGQRSRNAKRMVKVPLIKKL